MKKSLLIAEIFVSLKGYRKIVNIKNPPPYAREMIAVVVSSYFLLTYSTSLIRKTASVFNASLFEISSLYELLIYFVHLF